ncbi:MAG: hypothetical protein ACT4O6_10250 [Reyranella sp.]
MRISSEFFLRGIDLLTRVQGDKLISGLIFVALWHGQMATTKPRPASVRELARQIRIPYETVRRHAAALVAAGQCVATPEGIVVRTAVLRRQSNVDFLHGIYLNSERMLVDLTRAGLAKFRPSRVRARGRSPLTREQTAIATAAMWQLLAGTGLTADFWKGDLLRGLVYMAIWTANVKHITNTAPAETRTVLPDEQRRPVSALAISNSLRLPYETVRRHANGLLKDGICLRVGRGGLVVPASTHRKFSDASVEILRIVTAVLVEMRRAGVRV